MWVQMLQFYNMLQVSLCKYNLSARFFIFNNICIKTYVIYLYFQSANLNNIWFNDKDSIDRWLNHEVLKSLQSLIVRWLDYSIIEQLEV
jgi:hypothetical protein